MGGAAINSQSRKDWILTYTGRRFFPLIPQAEDIDIRDIAHALSNQCRFTGHTRDFYSVAQHSVLVSLNCDPQDALWGLLHDAPEAYLVDLATPLKLSMELGPTYRWFEGGLMLSICDRFNIPRGEPKSVKLADKRSLVTEQRDLMGVGELEWWAEATEGHYPYEPFEEEIIPLPPKTSELLFLRRFDELTGETNGKVKTKPARHRGNARNRACPFPVIR